MLFFLCYYLVDNNYKVNIYLIFNYGLKGWEIYVNINSLVVCLILKRVIIVEEILYYLFMLDVFIM